MSFIHLSALSPAPGISPRSCRCPCRCPCPRPPRPRLRSWPLLSTLPAVFTSRVSSAKSVSTCNFVTIAAMSPTAGAGLLRVLCLPFLDHNKNKLQSHPKQCVSILFQRNFLFPQAAVEVWHICLKKKIFRSLSEFCISQQLWVLLMLNIFLIFPVDARMFLIQHCPGTSRCFLQTTKC